MEFAFWTAVLFIAYTYAGYPFVIWMLSRLKPADGADLASVGDWPSVTVIMAVHNEQARIGAKLENLRTQDYEAGRMQIIVVSDGSTDDTQAIVARYPGVMLVAYAERRGKPHAINRALEHATGEIVVFTDVRQALDPGAIRHLVARLMSPGVGAVSGELVHVDPATPTASNIGLYWRYERWIRRAESRFASTVGVTGALYAIRRKDFEPLPPDTLLDDFVMPMRIARRGLRVVLERKAILRDELQSEAAGERKRKVRTLTGNFQAFARYPWLFLPGANPLLLQFLSHKVFRLFVPYAMGVALITSLLADGVLYRLAAFTQLAFYGFVLPGFVFPVWRRNRLVNIGLVFLELNWAAVLALRDFATGRIDARWEKT